MAEASNTDKASTQDLPTEVRTFLIADLRGYTAFTQERGDEDAARLATKFADLAREAIRNHGGEVVELRGDEALAVFRSPRSAIRAALALQHCFAQERAGDPALPLVAGVGLDAGEAVPVENGYRGGALNLAARLCSVAGPGEVLASETVANLARKVAGVAYGTRRSLPLKGFAEDVIVVPVFSDSNENTRTHETVERIEEQHSIPQALPVGGFLGAQPEGALIAQVPSLEEVQTALASVRGGSGRAILASGEPGIGKTRFAQEVLLIALGQSFLVGAATCYESRQSVPFFAICEALSDLATKSHSEATRPWLTVQRLLSGEEPASGAERRERDQDRVFRKVYDFVRSLAHNTPIAVMLDDLQWADASSLELLVYLARQARGSRLLLFGTYRDIDVTRDHRLFPLLLELDRQKLVNWVRLRRLDPDATGRLAASVAGAQSLQEELTRLIYAHTDGNPYFTQEVVRSMLERGEVEYGSGQWNASSMTSIQVPERVRALIDQRVARLEESARDILVQASVLGTTFNFDEIEALCKEPEQEIERVLKQSVDTGLLREIDADSFAFAHPLARQSLYDDLPGRRRKRLHRAAGEALVSRSTRSAEGGRRSGSAQIAWHFLQADDPDRALEYGVRAGDEAEAVFAHAEAERHYRQALEVARLNADDGRVAEILERLAAVLRTLGQYDDALEALEQAAQIYEALHDPEGGRRALALSAHLESLRERPDEGLARLDSLLERSQEADPSPGSVLVYVARAQVLLAMRRFEEAGSAAEQAAQGARALGDHALLAEAEVRRGEALGSQGHFEVAARVLEEAVSLARGGNRGTIVRALNGIGSATFYAGKFARSRAYHERALGLALEIEDPRSIAVSRGALGWRMYFLGSWTESRRGLEEAVSTAEQYGMQSLVEQMKIFLAHLALLEGRTQDLDGLLDVSSRPRSRDRRDAAIGMAALVRASQEIMEGRYRDAIQRLQTFDLDGGGANWHMGSVALTLARAYLGDGKIADAETLVAKTAAQAIAHKNRPTFVESLWVRGMTRVLQQHWDEAIRLFEASRTLANEMPFPFLEAMTLRASGTAYLARGMKSHARRDLEAALRILHGLSASPYIRQVGETLARLGQD